MKLRYSDYAVGNLYQRRGHNAVSCEKEFKAAQKKIAQNSCPNCRSPLTQVEDYDNSDQDIVSFGSVDVCTDCNWWSALKTFIDGHDEDENALITTRIFFSVLKKYKISDKDPTLEFVDRELRKNPDVIAKMNKTAFEKYMQDILREHYCKKVLHVGRSCDGGVDLLMIDDEERTLVQVKNRMLHKSEGSPVVRDLLGAMVQKNTFNGLILSTGRHFTKEAVKTAEEALSHGKVQKIEFKNCQEILEMINVVSEKREEPWKPASKILFGK
ncbi:Restriction endonuclease [compost metagenome]